MLKSLKLVTAIFVTSSLVAFCQPGHHHPPHRPAPRPIIVAPPAPIVVAQPAPVVVAPPAPVVVAQPTPVVVAQPAPVVVPLPTSPLLTHGPWLTFPNVGSITISYTTAPMCGAGVEFREKGTPTWIEAWHTINGQLFRLRQQHSINIFGLKPDTVYEYRLVIARPQAKEYHDGNFPRKDATINTPQVDYVEHPNFWFRTFTDQPRQHTVAITSDLQFSPQVKEQILTCYYNNCGLRESDLFMILGDGDNGLWNFENNYIRTIVDNVVKLNGTFRPTMFVRGNHEWRGTESALWCDYFCDPLTGSTFSSFRCGEVYYIVLETGEDKPAARLTAHYTGNNLAEEQLWAEQHSWLEAVVATPEFQTAKFRVVLSHGIIYSHPETYMHNNIMKICGDLFTKDKPQNRIHLWVGGHDHLYCRTVPGTDVVYRFAPVPQKIFNGMDYTFPCVTLEGPGNNTPRNVMMLLSALTDKLNISVKDENGQLVDAFDILPDGNVIDLNNNTLPTKQVPANYK